MKKLFGAISVQTIAIICILTFSIAGLHRQAAAEGNYILSTASTGGTYYPVGVAISTLVKVKLQNSKKIGMSAIPSAGSAENVKLLNENQAQFAILQALYGNFAAKGVGPFKQSGPSKDIYAVTMLWQNVEHFVINKKYVKSGNFDDMKNVKGMTIAMGAKNSGTIGSNGVLLKSLGLDIDNDFDLFHGGYGPSLTAVTDGKAMAAGTPAGVPVGAVTTAFASKGDELQVLSFTKDQIAAANKGYDVWSSYTIKAGTYPSQSKAVRTIAQPNFLAVRGDVSEEDVFAILEALYDNLDFLKNIHQATSVMTLENNEDGVSTALGGLPMKLHPGAVKFYESRNIAIPANLK